MKIQVLISQTGNEPLPEYGKRYFEHIVAEYRSLVQGTVPGYISAIIDKYTGDLNAPTWGDLYLLEKYVLSIQAPETLKRRAWNLRSDYLDMTGPRAYEMYLRSRPPDENDPNCDVDALRADLDRVLDSLHWSYALIPIRERLRTSIVRTVGLVLLLSMVLTSGLVYLFSFYHQTLFSWILLVMLAGAIGGFMSLQQRVQNIPTVGDPLVSIFEIENGRFSIYLAPVSGAIFAAVLLALFMGGLISGQLFPTFSGGGLKFYLEKFQWVGDGGYLDSIGYAKLLVWSFIAGFAERFVPDTLDRLIAKAQSTDSSKAPTVSPNPSYLPSLSPLARPRSSPPSGKAGTSPPQRNSPPWR
ncbi:MAG TPA: hypothetical protein VFN26_14890 [Candidatus Acidoferrum sp.]|nr:hypothetical protein [Candidatus Acidoferrum sp.]